MKVKWVSQENPTSDADALEKSIGKWRFFSYCTRKQFLPKQAWIGITCGLCNWYSETAEVFRCKVCFFAEHRHCPIEYTEARDLADDYPDCTLAEVHTASRKVFKKLKSLRKQLSQN